MVGAGVKISSLICKQFCNLTLILLTSLFISSLNAQEREGLFWNYTVDDGLPSNEVYHIHEDSKGYMWFATANGVSRFDGYEFHNYSVEEGILDSDIFQIVEDSQGIMYLYSISGRIYEGDDKGFTMYSQQKLIDSVIKANKTSGSWAEDVIDGYLKVDYEGNLHIIRPTTHFKFSKDRLLNTVSKESMFHTLIDKDNLFLCRFQHALNNKTLNSLSDSLESKAKIFSIKIVRDSTYHLNLPIIYNFKNRRIENRNDKIKKWKYIKIKNNLYSLYAWGSFYFFSSDSLIHMESGNSNVEIIKLLADSSYLVGYLGNKGLRIYRNYKDVFKNKYFTVLNNYSISYIFLDSRNILWISTTNGGVFTIPYNILKSNKRNTKDNTLNLNYISSDKKNTIYVSSNKEEIYSVVLSSFKVTKMYSGNRIKDIQYDTLRKILWFTDGTLSILKNSTIDKYWASGNFRRGINKNRWTIDQNVGVGLNQFHIAEKYIWLAESVGIVLFNMQNRTVAQKKYIDYNSTALRVNTVYQEIDSLIWMGTQHGVFTYNLDSIAISSDSILNQDVAVYHIKSSPEGLFFGTKGRGLYHHTDSITQVINNSNGLTSNFIESLIAVDSNELWVGTPNGLNRLIFDSTGDYRFQYYSVATGLPSNTINDLEYCNDKVYAATPEGLGIIDPDEKIETHPIQPLISEVLVNNHPYTIEDLKELGSTERNLIIKYDCLDYKQMGNILYRYRLKEGDIWNETKERTVNLLRLPPGDYRFEVQAMGADRSWSDSKTLRFSIAPPLWQRYWFWGAISISVFGLVFTYTRSRFREVKRQASLQQKVAHLERKALRAQMNPHFIFNVLHSIQGYISEGDTQNATRYVSKFARLIRATLNHSRMTKIPLEEEIQNLKEYLDLENMRMDGQLTYQFHIPEELDSFDYDIPPMLIQPFLENSIKHGISPKGKGHIDVKIRKINQHLEIQVIDDGIGIEESLRQKKESKNRPSLGMHIAKERLSVLEGEEKEEHIHIGEIKDEEGNAAGTKVEILIKIDQDN